METRVEREGVVQSKDSEDLELGERVDEGGVYRSTTEAIDEADSSVRARIKERRRRLSRKLTCWVACCLVAIVVLGALGVLSVELEELNNLQVVFDIVSAFSLTGASPSSELGVSKANGTKCC